MALQGTLKDFGLADILQLIGIQRKTGVLTLDSGSETVTVKFREGQVVGADSSTRNLEDVLGSVLVRTGRITETQLAEALRTQRSTLQRVGYILVKSNAISEDTLQEALRIQVTQMVYRLFRWRDGQYQFASSDHVDYDREHFQPIGAETILMEGARMLDEWPIIERRIRSALAVFRKTAAGAAIERPVASLVEAHVDFGFTETSGAGSAVPEEGIRLSPDEQEVLRMVDGRSRVQDLVDRSPLGEFDVYRALHELLNRHLIEEVPALAGAEIRGAARAVGATNRFASWAFVAAALFSVSTLGVNPATPLKLATRSGETDLLKGYASRERIERIERAMRVFYFDLGGLPERLESLTGAGYLRPADLLDPWGRPYRYEVWPAGYRIVGFDPGGQPAAELVLQHRLSAAERMVLEYSVRPAAEEPSFGP